jgi:hypothetical protein
MIISLEALARRYEVKPDTRFSNENKVESWQYNKFAITLILFLSALFSLIGIALVLLAMASSSVDVAAFGILFFVIGCYQTLATVKEKSNLDLLTAHFDGLSESAKQELLTLIIHSNAIASRGLFKFIEKLLNRGA